MKTGILRADASAEFYFEEGCHILELSNDADDPAVSIARARVAPGEITRWHYLVDIDERYVILAGRGDVELDEREPIAVGAGDVVRIPAGSAQRIRNTGSEDLVFLAICNPRFRPENYRSGKAGGR